MENIDKVIALIAATGGLGLAAMSLVDAFKALPSGGISRIGFSHIREVLKLFDTVLARAVGPEWETVILSHWINGRSRGDQIGVIRSLLRLGLNPETAGQLAPIGNVEKKPLEDAAGKLVKGAALSEAEINLIGRVEAAVEARLDAAFDLADQAYRNISRVLAGVIAVALAVAAWVILDQSSPPIEDLPDWGAAVLVGVLAVPIAPIAKDLVSALTAAARAVKSTRNP
jgi:hypothetical protein